MRRITTLLMLALLTLAPTAIAGETDVRVQYADEEVRCESDGYGQSWRENGTGNDSGHRERGWGYAYSSCDQDMPDARVVARQDGETLAGAEFGRRWQSSQGHSYEYTRECETEECWWSTSGSGRDTSWDSFHGTEGARVHTFLTGDATWMLTRCDAYGYRSDAYAWGGANGTSESSSHSSQTCRHGETRVDALGFYDGGILACSSYSGGSWGRDSYSSRDCFLGRDESIQVNGTGTQADGTRAHARAGNEQGEWSWCSTHDAGEQECYSHAYDRLVLHTDLETQGYGSYHGRHAYDMA